MQTLFGAATEPPVDPRAAELAQQHAEHVADVAERERLSSAQVAAVARRERARADLHAIINDPMTHATTPPDKRAAAGQELVDAGEAVMRAEADLAAHVAAHGDLDGRARELSARQHSLDHETVRAAHREIAGRRVRALLEAESCELEEFALLRDAFLRWPEDTVHPLQDGGSIHIQRGAGLVPLVLPAGILLPGPTPTGLKSVLRDDLLRAVATVYPDLLPADRTKEIQAAVEADRRAGGYLIAGTPGWHFVQAPPSAANLRGRQRLETRGILA